VRSFEAIQVKNTLSGILKGVVQLPVTILYDHPTITSLADWLLQLIGVGEIDIPKVEQKKKKKNFFRKGELANS
jgi:hypothetical protein